MSPAPDAADRLNDYLDAVVTGAATPSHDNGDASLVALVEHVFNADDAPPPPPGLAEQVWEELMGAAKSGGFVPPVLALRPDRNGKAVIDPRLATPPNHHTTPPHRGPSAIAYFATAALLVLTLVGGFVALRGSLRLMSSDQRTLIIPAIDNTPQSVRPSEGVTDDVVLQATWETLGQMPSSRAQHELALGRSRLAPGAVQPVGSQEDTGTGLSMFTVEAGQVTVEADAPVLVTRADANQETAPSPVSPGTAVVLEVGDQLYAPSGVSFRRRNDGSTPAILLDFSLSSVGDNYFDQNMLPGVTDDAGFPFKLMNTFPPVPAEATVHRRTLAPGAELALRDLPGLELVYVESGALDLVFDKGGTLEAPERVRTLSAGNGTDVFGRTPDRAVLANRGDEPLVILTASVVPAGASQPTAQAEWPDGWGAGDYCEAGSCLRES
jgi:hypothetical protein